MPSMKISQISDFMPSMKISQIPGRLHAQHETKPNLRFHALHENLGVGRRGPGNEVDQIYGNLSLIWHEAKIIMLLKWDFLYLHCSHSPHMPRIRQIMVSTKTSRMLFYGEQSMKGEMACP